MAIANGIGQYIGRKSILHSLDPRTKLFLLFCFAVMVLLKSAWWNHILAFLAIFLATIVSKVGIKKAFALIWTFRLFLLITFTIHFFFTPGDFGFDWGIIHISFAGAQHGALFAIRIGLLMWSAALFGWITSPIALGDALEKIFAFLKIFRIPPRDVSMVVLLAMRFIPTMMDDAQKIHWAQLARGGNISGGIMKRAKQIVPMVVPLFVSAFRRADKLALALELRGYDPHTKRTRIDPIEMKSRDWSAIAIATLATLITIAIAVSTS